MLLFVEQVLMREISAGRLAKPVGGVGRPVTSPWFVYVEPVVKGQSIAARCSETDLHEVPVSMQCMQIRPG